MNSGKFDSLRPFARHRLPPLEFSITRYSSKPAFSQSFARCSFPRRAISDEIHLLKLCQIDQPSLTSDQPNSPDLNVVLNHIPERHRTQNLGEFSGPLGCDPSLSRITIFRRVFCQHENLRLNMRAMTRHNADSVTTLQDISIRSQAKN